MRYNVKQFRLENDLTQEELAGISGVSRPTIIKIENGEETEVKITTLEALASALNKRVSDLLCD